MATVSFSYSSEGSSSYYAGWGWWGYGWTATVTAAEGYTITKCVFYDDSNRTATDSEAPFVVETTEGDKTPQVNGTPIQAYQSKGITKIEVYGYAASAGNTVSFDANSGTGTMADVTGVSGSYTLPACTFTAPDGKEFDKWQVNGNTYDAGQSITVSTNTTVTATWKDSAVTFTVKRVAKEGSDYADGSYTVAAGTTWQQFIDSGNAPACLSIGTSGIYNGKVCHDMENDVQCCGGTLIANTADKKRVKSGDAIIDGATYACSDYLNYEDHD